MTLLVVAGIVLGMAAIYVGTIAAAFSALMRLPLRLAAERDRTNGLGRYLDDPMLLFVPLRIVLGLVVALAAIVAARLIGVERVDALGTVVLAMVAFVAVCEHLVPLLIVRRNPEAVLTFMLPSFEPVARALRPLARALVGTSAPGRRERQAAAALVGEEGGEEPDEERTEAGDEAGEDRRRIEREERAMLQSIVDFGDTLVREVMTPRPDIVAIRSTATVADLRALLAEQEYSRIPAYEENLDHIVGFVYTKDLVHQDPPATRTVSQLLRPALFVPETKRVAELLKDFQRQQVQFAIVVDEYGGTAGLVTLEDLIEEIVGEIRDEYDVETEPVIDEGSGTFVFSGKAGIHELVERLGVEIEREGFETVGGFLLSHAGRVPLPGETFDIAGLHIEVLETERRRIGRVRVSRQPQPVTQSG